MGIRSHVFDVRPLGSPAIMDCGGRGLEQAKWGPIKGRACLCP